MTRREYLKYNQEMYDKQKKRINPGDIVVINNNYSSTPHIGVVEHFTESGYLCIKYVYAICKGKEFCCLAYRKPHKVVKLRNGRKKIK